MPVYVIARSAATKQSQPYGRVDRERAQQIIDRHLKSGEIIKEWVID